MGAIPARIRCVGRHAKHTCDKPDEFPGKLASDTRRRAWQKTMDDYGTA